MKKRFRSLLAAVREKCGEAAGSALPVIVIVALLCLSVSPIETDVMLCFVVGAVMVIFGEGLFSLGAETAMQPIGGHIGSAMTRTRKLPLILAVSFVSGFAVTVAEPDLQVLAASVPHIDSTVLLLTVGLSVGLFLTVCMVRIVTGLRLRWLLLVLYAAVFALAFFADTDLLGIAFDSGGVTTGPMTVPYILALGVGVSRIRSDGNAGADSFGLVSLCSVGPILAVLLLGFYYSSGSAVFSLSTASYADTVALGSSYLAALPAYLTETAISLAPIVLLFLLFQLFSLRLSGHTVLKLVVGLVYTYVGLVLFLTGVNIGFSPLGTVLGLRLADTPTRWMLIPVSVLLGWFIITAEPAVRVLQKQIAEVSAGAIPERAVRLSLSAAVALAMGISMLRVLTGIPLMVFLIPGYVLALALSFFVPDIYTAIAFDSGGVASGPMTAAFMLRFMIGASAAVGGNTLRDAFGCVAMVAMMPLLSIQLLGVIYGRRKAAPAAESYSDDEIIELWEVSA